MQGKGKSCWTDKRCWKCQGLNFPLLQILLSVSSISFIEMVFRTLFICWYGENGRSTVKFPVQDKEEVNFF